MKNWPKCPFSKPNIQRSKLTTLLWCCHMKLLTSVSEKCQVITRISSRHQKLIFSEFSFFFNMYFCSFSITFFFSNMTVNMLQNYQQINSCIRCWHSVRWNKRYHWGIKFVLRTEHNLAAIEKKYFKKLYGPFL